MSSIAIQLSLGGLAVAGLLLGAQGIVHGAKKLALRLKLSEFFIGLTLLSVLTSLPEITEHVVASISILKDPSQRAVLSAIAIGTNVGSNIIQITLITGIVGLFGVLVCDNRFLKKDYLFMMFGILLVWLFSFGGVSRLEGVVLTLLYIAYLAHLGWGEKAFDKLSTSKGNLFSEIFIIGLGFLMLIFSANYILKLAVFFSDTYHISGSLIGTLVIGFATALPELTTALTALIKKSPKMGIATLVGSNITNPLLALGLGASISGYTVGSTLLWFDIPFWFAISGIGFFLFWKGKYLSKPQALTLILFYFIYLVLRIKLFL